MRTLKTWGPVAILLVVFAITYLAGAQLRGDDADPLDQAGSDLTPAPSSTTSASASPTNAAPTVITPSGTVSTAWGVIVPRDLEEDERSGGHTLARHVGKTDADLAARLKAEPDISAASSYRTRDLASLAIAGAIGANEKKIADWEKKTGERANLAIRWEAPEVVGRTFDRDEKAAADTRDVVVVLRWSGKDWYVLTSYPE